MDKRHLSPTQCSALAQIAPPYEVTEIYGGDVLVTYDLVGDPSDHMLRYLAENLRQYVLHVLDVREGESCTQPEVEGTEEMLA